MTESIENKIKQFYNDPTTGLVSADKLYLKLNKAGINVSKNDVKKFYAKYAVTQINKQALKPLKQLKIRASGVNNIWQADLLDVTKYAKWNKGYNYILTIIDIYSRYGWAFAIKRKEAKLVTEAFSNLDVYPNELTTDNGLEFLNRPFKKLMKENNIIHYTNQPGDHNHMGVIERFNKTIRMRLAKLWSINGNVNWINYLDKIIKGYNNTIHKTTGHTPSEIYSGEAKNKQPPNEHTKDKFKAGDKVRTLLELKLFEKGSLPRWSSHIYTIEQRTGNKYKTSKSDHLYRASELQKIETVIESNNDNNNDNKTNTKEANFETLNEQGLEDPNSQRRKEEIKMARRMKRLAKELN